MFLSVAYFVVANSVTRGISYCYVSAKSQYLVDILALC